MVVGGFGIPGAEDDVDPSVMVLIRVVVAVGEVRRVGIPVAGDHVPGALDRLVTAGAFVPRDLAFVQIGCEFGGIHRHMIRDGGEFRILGSAPTWFNHRVMTFAQLWWPLT
ncbi:hypothetical protein [Nocardia sp. NPDC059195]|uniref:hypothetical protein n=1 Tax=Nocardia sp. NPDC059195 TaxID=3346765 RepID=UPI0036A3BE0C